MEVRADIVFVTLEARCFLKHIAIQGTCSGNLIKRWKKCHKLKKLRQT